MTNGEKEARRLRGGRGEEGRGEGRAWIRTRKCRTSRTRPRPRVWKLAETSFLRDIIILLPISTCPSSLDPLLRLRAILRLECEPCAIYLLRAARGSRAPTRHGRVGGRESGAGRRARATRSAIADRPCARRSKASELSLPPPPVSGMFALWPCSLHTPLSWGHGKSDADADALTHTDARRRTSAEGSRSFLRTLTRTDAALRTLTRTDAALALPYYAHGNDVSSVY